ncbi:MAG: cell division protein CrgA [Actinomycetaceae bacterium]|nr:cell division protein CrgA [Actinomycetaceae bacterium]
MPESKKRKKKDGHDAVADTEIASWTDGMPLSPAWWAPAFITLLLVGLIWLIVYYISAGQYPIPGINWWNLVIGLGIMLVGFFMTMRWR